LDQIKTGKTVKLNTATTQHKQSATKKQLQSQRMYSKLCVDLHIWMVASDRYNLLRPDDISCPYTDTQTLSSTNCV